MPSLLPMSMTREFLFNLNFKTRKHIPQSVYKYGEMEETYKYFLKVPRNNMS